MADVLLVPPTETRLAVLEQRLGQDEVAKDFRHEQFERRIKALEDWKEKQSESTVKIIATLSALGLVGTLLMAFFQIWLHNWKG